MATTEMRWQEWAARHYEPKARQWETPGDLAKALDPQTRDSLPLRVINRELVRLADHQVPADALAVFMPPQEGKSYLVARRFPEWLLAHNPGLRIAIVSYEQEMAVRWGRQILRDLRHADPGILNVRVMADSSAAGRWDTPEGGGIYCVGIGGALTGRPVDVLDPTVLLVDDPVKGREEAESETYRERAFDWWESTALTRLASGGIVCLIQTRWHQDDLSGRILSRPSPLRWRVLNMPAISEGKGDPLGRPEGAEFPSVRDRAPGYFRNLRATMSPYVFSSIYQQSPTAAEGNFFKRQAFRYWHPVLGVPDPGVMLARQAMAGAWLDLDGIRVDLADPGVWRFAVVDVAASVKTSADYTVCGVFAIDRMGNLILLDLARGRVEMGAQFSMVAPLRAKWRFDVCYVERSFFSKTLVVDARNAGVPVAEVQADTDKVSRAIPAAGRLHAGKLWFPHEAPWLEALTSELLAFPAGTHDDQADVIAYAARVAAAHWVAPAPQARPVLSRDLEAIAAAHAAATGNGHEIDLMSAPLG